MVYSVSPFKPERNRKDPLRAHIPQLRMSVSLPRILLYHAMGNPLQLSRTPEALQAGALVSCTPGALGLKPQYLTHVYTSSHNRACNCAPAGVQGAEQALTSRTFSRYPPDYRQLFCFQYLPVPGEHTMYRLVCGIILLSSQCGGAT